MVFVNFSLFKISHESDHTHTHTHTYIHIYIEDGLNENRIYFKEYETNKIIYDFELTAKKTTRRTLATTYKVG